MTEVKPLKITETVLRDGPQSLVATRMRVQDMIPVLEKLDNVGYHAIEAWGGATFDACLRFLDEDPWGRLRILRHRMPNTPIQMLLRGQNLLGYNHYADDVVSEFIKKSVENGVSIIRVFDALNDTRNLKLPLKQARRPGPTCRARWFTQPVRITNRRTLCGWPRKWYRWGPIPSALKIWRVC